jgi:hypothetical protein
LKLTLAFQYGDYVIHKAMTYGVTPFEGIRDASEGSVTFAQGGERWSNDEDGFPEAIAAAEAADVAVVVVGTWSRDQNELWGGLNATTGKSETTPPCTPRPRLTSFVLQVSTLMPTTSSLLA